MKSHVSVRLTAAAAAVALSATLAACGSSSNSDQASAADGSSLTTVTLSLDYIANNAGFAGFYAAEKLGYYQSAGIKLKIQPYTDTTADVLVNAGKADFGTIDEPSLIMDQAAGQKLVAIMALMQHSAARIAIASKDTSEVNSPKDLTGKTFGGFGVPMEKAINDGMIAADGAKPNYKTVTLGVSVYDALTSGQVDWAIPYDTDDIQWAKLRGKAWKILVPQDYGVPDYYEKMILSSDSFVQSHADLTRRFLAATQKGFAYAAAHPADAISTQSKMVQGEFIIKDQTATASLLASHYWLGTSGKVGAMDAARWTQTAQFLLKQGMLKDSNGKALSSVPDVSGWFTNTYLPAGS